MSTISLLRRWRSFAYTLSFVVLTVSPSLALAVDANGGSTELVRLPRAAVLGVRASTEGSGGQKMAQRAAALTDVLAVELSRTGQFRVVTQADANAMVDLSRTQELLGCDSGDCLKTLGEMGGALNVQRLVTGNITDVQGAPIFNVVIMDTSSSTVAGRGSTPLTDDLEGTMQGVRKALLEALGYSGRIILWNQPDRGEVYVDGRHVGSTPVRAIFVEKPASYRLQVFHEERTPWEQQVEVKEGEVLRVKVDSASLLELEAAADATDSLGLSLIGGGVAAGVVGGVFWFLAGSAQKDFENTDWRGLPVREQKPYTDTIMSRTVTAAAFSGVAAIGVVAGAMTLLTNGHRAKLDSYGRGAAKAAAASSTLSFVSFAPIANGLLATWLTQF